MEHGVDQIVRDVRGFSVYEGANGIQALDLVGRKLLSDRGVRLGRLFDEIDVSLRGMEDLPQVRALRRLLGELRDVVARLDVARANEVAAHLLRALGHRSEEHTSELQSLMRISSAVFFLKKK